MNHSMDEGPVCQVPYKMFENSYYNYYITTKFLMVVNKKPY